MKKMKTFRKLWAVIALFAMMTNTVLPAVEVFANETDSSSTIQETNPASNEAPVDTIADLDTEQPVKESSEAEAEIQSEVDQQEDAKANDSPTDKNSLLRATYIPPVVSIGSGQQTFRIEKSSPQYSDYFTVDLGRIYATYVSEVSQPEIWLTNQNGEKINISKYIFISSDGTNLGQPPKLNYTSDSKGDEYDPFCFKSESISILIDKNTVEEFLKRDDNLGYFDIFLNLKIKDMNGTSQSVQFDGRATFGGKGHQALKIVKSSEDKNISNINFEVYKKVNATSDWELIDRRVTNKDGIALIGEIGGVDSELYLVKEIVDDKYIPLEFLIIPYKLNEMHPELLESYKDIINNFKGEIIRCNQGDVDLSLDVSNRMRKGEIEIKKIDSAEKTKSLAGATFKITNTDTNAVFLAESEPTNDSGYLKISNIPYGNYTLEEVTPPAGYAVSSEKKRFSITKDTSEEGYVIQHFDFENTKTEEPKGSVKITKVDRANPSTKLAGATFKVTNAVSGAVVIEETAGTSSTGELTISDLPIGKYEIVEVKAPTGYEVSKDKLAFEVTKDNVTKVQTFDFANDKTEEKVGKVSIQKYDLADSTKKSIAGAKFTLYEEDGKKEVATKTSEAGKLLVFDNLPLGKYVLKETEAPAGYEKASYTKEIEITENDLELTIEVSNKKSETPKGNVTIKKTEKGDVDNKLIADAEFTLTDSKGVAVTKKTVAGKELVFDNLALGEYTLEETSAPAGYETPDFKQTFEVKEGTLSFTYDVENVKSETPKGKVSIKKYKLGDEDEKLIADAEFTLTDSEENVVDTKTTKEGEELVFDNLEYGEYTLEETSAPAGYEKPDFKKTFEVKSGALNFEYTVYNKETPRREVGKVTIKKHKLGDEDEKLIADAEFTLTDSEENVVDTKTTKKGEELVFDNLPYGKYTLEETSAPTGYEKPDFKETFEVKSGDLNFEYTVYNKEIPDIPEISTTAKDGETGNNEGYADEKVTIIDKVDYKNLEVGKTYTVKGTLMDKETGLAFVTKDGNEVHAEKEFEAKTKDGFVELEFVITNGDLKGKTVVVFEDLYDGEKKVATHSEIDDENQSVDYPKVGTKASESTVGDKIVVKDIVSYEKLTVGKEYTVEGKLMDKATGKAFEVDGTAVTSKATFKPEAENGTTEVTFEFDKAAIEGQEISLVVFEKVLNADGKVIGIHEDLEDGDQTVEFKPDTPEIATSAKDGETGTNEGYADEKVTIIDKVTYKNLTIGKTYTVKGVLMDKQTGKAFVTKDGNEVHAEKEFKADKSNGSVELEFVVTNGDLAGKTVVVFENMYHEDVEVAAHTDIEDKDQSVDYPKVGTKASESTVGDKIIVKDIVSYEKLTVGKEYTVEGKLMDKATGKAFEVDGVAVTAKATFKPEAENGTTEVTFEFDKAAIEGKEISLVVFEKVLNADGKVIGIHEDLEDGDQTVEFKPDTPEIATSAKDGETGTNEGYADEKVTIIDKVTYKNLTIGKTYTVKGVLMDKQTGKAFVTKDGKEVHAEKEFKAEKSNGSVELEFVVTNGDLAGKTVVVFENMYHEDVEVAAHTDIEDKDQSVDYPKVGTKASESTVGDKIIVKDIVSYEKLTAGKEYTLEGKLMDKETGKAFEVDGVPVTTVTKFTPEAENGTTEVTFEFDKKAIEGKEISLVVFEKVLNADGKVIGTHEDLEDPEQTVEFGPDTPEIATTAKDSETGDHEGNADEQVSIIDTVEYKNLTIGKTYTVKGVLMDKGSNQPFITRDGNEVHAEKEFVAETTNGSVDLEFVITNGDLAGKTVVVFENLFREDKQVASHTDINDKDQSVDYPKVGTKASESTVGDKIIVKDIVSYEKLTVGKAYTVKGTLMDKATGKAFEVDGKAVTAETTFTPDKAAGTTEVTFEFDKKAVEGKDIALVVFEKVYNVKGQLIGSHEDLEDKDQTVSFTPDTPEIATKAKDKGTASNEGQAKKEVTIIDEVSYKNLIVGKEYTVKGVLMDKATNKPLLANGKEVHAEKTFTAKKPNGTIDLEFTFDGSALAGTTVVVFETLYTDNKEVATHTDINDKDQTVTYPKVGTKASDSLVNDNVVIKDMVSYENLVVGNKYTVKGVLMDKSTGLAYLVDGKKVLGETTFVAAQTSGTVEVTFEFAKSALTKKETLVVFEQLFNSKGYLIATHEDINDKDQTVEVGDNTPGKPGLPSTGTGGKTRTYDYSTSTSRGSLPKTGTQNNPLLLVLGVIIIGTVLTMYLVYTRRAKRNH